MKTVVAIVFFAIVATAMAGYLAGPAVYGGYGYYGYPVGRHFNYGSRINHGYGHGLGYGGYGLGLGYGGYGFGLGYSGYGYGLGYGKAFLH
ncbi:uncharacterized protein LOC143240031 [Tachypleus tridentatus]|uniref:uncharacterized protein LOC143240031 n=1 Tax=Tachypleus tridentatus TaxID=6853 RepID=UPI003FCFB2A1